MGAYAKDILRAILKDGKRFFAIVTIIVLGVTMFSGLKAACTDLRKTADAFYDEGNLHDLYIVSTLGLTDDDIKELSEVDGVNSAEGVYIETAEVKLNDEFLSIAVRNLGDIDVPYVTKGHLPQKINEAAVTEEFLNKSGLSLGDSFTIEEELDPGDEDNDPEEPTFLNTEFTVSAVIVDVTSIDNPNETAAFRSSQTAETTIYVLPEAIDTEVYTGVSLTLDSASELFCYGEEYTSLVSRFKKLIESEIKTQREEARYAEVIDDANREIDDAEAEANAELADAYRELVDGEKELNDSLAEAEAELADAYQKLLDGEKELYESLADAKAQLEDARAQLENGEAELYESLADAKAQLEDARTQLEEGEEELYAGKAELEEGEAELREQEAQAEASFSAAWAQIEENRRQIDEGFAQLDYETNLAQIEAGENAVEEARQALESQETEAINTAAAQAVAQAEATAEAAAREAFENDPSVIRTKAYLDEQEETLQERKSELEAAHDLGTIDDAKYNKAMTEIENAEAVVEKARQELETQEAEAINAAVAQAAAQAEATAEAAAREAFENDPSVIRTKAYLDEQEETLRESRAALESAYAELSSASNQLDEGIAELEAQEASARVQFDAAWAQIAESKNLIEESEKTIADGWAEYEDGIKEYEEGKAEGEAEIADGWAEYRGGLKEYEEGKAKGEAEIADGWAEYEDGLKEYEEGKAKGEAEIADGWAEYEDGKAEAQDKIADARAELADIDMATWYVQDRTSLNGFTNVSSDADSIETIGTVFPVIFFIVAILIALTAITRMVDEDRGLIGTYKALGFTSEQIRRKYIVYFLLAGLLGSLIGTFLAFVVLPYIIFVIFKTMYLFPDYLFAFVPLEGFAGPILFAAGVTFCAGYTCQKKINHQPATLMRPKAPKSGTRILFERIPCIWSRLSFLNKVTARNLFRYKKRLLMTISGIAGCTALLLFGFSIKDSVSDLMPKQYGQIFEFDLMGVSTADDNDLLLSYIENDEQVAQYINAEITSVNISYKDSEDISVTLIAFPKDCDIDSYIHLNSTDGTPLKPEDGKIYITRNAGSVLGFKAGDVISAQLADLTQAELPIFDIAENYMGNYIYMTENTFAEYFGEYEQNGVLLNFSDKCEDQTAYSDALSKEDGIVSCTSSEDMVNSFSSAFELINMVVYVVILMSAALAFVVLFTLQTTNISERERELATIKVLGFYDPEVHQYINKETYILSGIGILIGLPVGYGFSLTLDVLLNIPSIYLAPSLYAASYIYAVLLGAVFTIIVNFVSHKALNAIDPAKALKSIE